MEKFTNRKIKNSEVQNFKKNKIKNNKMEKLGMRIGCTSRAFLQQAKNKSFADVARHVPTVGVNHGRTARVKGRGLMERKPLCKYYNTSSGMNPDSNGCGGQTSRVSLATLGRARVNYTSSAVPTPKVIHGLIEPGCTSCASKQKYKAFKAHKAFRAYKAVLCKQSAPRLKAFRAFLCKQSASRLKAFKALENSEHSEIFENSGWLRQLRQFFVNKALSDERHLGRQWHTSFWQSKGELQNFGVDESTA